MFRNLPFWFKVVLFITFGVTGLIHSQLPKHEPPRAVHRDVTCRAVEIGKSADGVPYYGAVIEGTLTNRTDTSQDFYIHGAFFNDGVPQFVRQDDEIGD